jgi:hypothetical protein
VPDAAVDRTEAGGAQGSVRGVGLEGQQSKWLLKLFS